jgi:hypothetical protein
MADNSSLQRQLSRVAVRGLIDDAATVAGFAFKRPQFGSAANVSGVRTKTLVFSRRHDSRTMFASNAGYGHLGRAGAWTGPDRRAAAECRRVLRAAKVSVKEIGSIDVYAEMGQAAELAAGNEIHLREPTLMRKLARARRAVDGLPVWSSYATVGLTADGDLGWLELHWPELPEAVVAEGRVLQELAERGVEPPELAGARPERVEGGIIHSPAVGFYMDVTAALRVIYRSDEPTVGRKPTLYLDRHLEPVARPRDIPATDPDPVDRPRPPKAR